MSTFIGIIGWVVVIGLVLVVIAVSAFIKTAQDDLSDGVDLVDHNSNNSET